MVFIWPVRSTERRGEGGAAQGLVAGANAGLAAVSAPPFVLDRMAFIGVLIDDLISNGVTEPCMFSSRSEYRLTLRAENADLRLTDVAVKAGILPADSPRAERAQERKRLVEEGRKVLDSFRLSATVVRAAWTSSLTESTWQHLISWGADSCCLMSPRTALRKRRGGAAWTTSIEYLMLSTTGGTCSESKGAVPSARSIEVECASPVSVAPSRGD